MKKVIKIFCRNTDRNSINRWIVASIWIIAIFICSLLIVCVFCHVCVEIPTAFVSYSSGMKDPVYVTGLTSWANTVGPYCQSNATVGSWNNIAAWSKSTFPNNTIVVLFWISFGSSCFIMVVGCGKYHLLQMLPWSVDSFIFVT